MRVAGRLSPSRGPSPQPSPIQGEGVVLLFPAPLLKPSIAAEEDQPARGRAGTRARAVRAKDSPYCEPDAGETRREPAKPAQSQGRVSLGTLLVGTRKYLVCRDETRLIHCRR